MQPFESAVWSSRLPGFVLLLAALVLGSPVVLGAPDTLLLFGGTKHLNTDDWRPWSQQEEFGALLTLGPDDGRIKLALDLLWSQDDRFVTFERPGFTPVSMELKAQTTEVGLGLRKVWGERRAHPYFGAGISLIRAEREQFDEFGRAETDNGNSTGVWASLGCYWTIGAHFQLGFDARWSRADNELFGIDRESGGEHLGLTLGYGW